MDTGMKKKDAFVQNRQRIPLWDHLKLWLIFCVVAGHFLARFEGDPDSDRLLFWIYSFHMPGFVLISGLFSKGIIRKRRYDKIMSMLLAFLLMKYVLFIVKSMVRGELVTLSYSDLSDASWFAFGIFIYYLLGLFLIRFEPRRLLCVFLVIALMTGYAREIGSFLALSRIIVFFPFFWIGFWLDPHRLMNLRKKRWIRAAAFFCLCMYTVFVWRSYDRIAGLLPLLRGRSSYDFLKEAAAWGGLLRLGWYMGSFLLILCLILVIPAMDGPLSILGSRTLAVYVLHYVPLLLFFGKLQGKGRILSISHGKPLVPVLLLSMLVTGVLSLKPFSLIIHSLTCLPLQGTDG